ncbi:MAG TPA: hypothetical protein VFK57_23190 [Vicinamibacterales bacterium]|nr:hypothetical protein [Vicinamibacterales bacterium]
MTRNTSAWRGAVVGFWFLSACGGSPSRPSTVTTTTPPPAPASANPSSASILIEQPFAIVHAGTPRFGYEVRFLLREAGGTSGATIQRVVVYGPAGSDETAPSCWGDKLRVPAGGELDTFYTDTGAAWLGYCAPGSGGSTAFPALRVVITFSDDQGIVGTVGAEVPARR